MVDDDSLFTADRLAIFYTLDGEYCTMMKHGDYNIVQKDYDLYRCRLVEAGQIDMANEARLIENRL